MTEVVFEGAEQLRDLAKRLRQAGDKDLARELRKGIRSGAKPAQEAAKAGARGIPSRGTGNRKSRQRIAQGVGVQVRTGSSVRIVARTDSSLAGFARAVDIPGGFRHPVFGNPVWVTQASHPFFGDSIADEADTVRDHVIDGMDRVAARIAP